MDATYIPLKGKLGSTGAYGDNHATVALIGYCLIKKLAIRTDEA